MNLKRRLGHVYGQRNYICFTSSKLLNADAEDHLAQCESPVVQN